MLGLLDKYGDPHAIDRAMELVWAAAQLELRLLRIQPRRSAAKPETGEPYAVPESAPAFPSERIMKNRERPVGALGVRDLGRPPHRARGASERSAT